MASVQLVLGYLALALVIATVVVLFCLCCSCHVALGKCARWSCDATKRCRGTQSTEREQGRRRAPDACAASCLRAVPWLLTCGYCCGTFGDVATTNRQRAESAGATTAVAVGQPVFEKGQLATECVVAVSMPLLAVS